MPPYALASGAVPCQYMTLPGGNAGTDATVALMTQLAMGQYGARSPKVRALAINILTAAGVQSKDYEGELCAIHNWVRDNIRYLRDVQGQETLCPPEEILFNSKNGDCDDLSMAEAALLASVGFSTRFKCIGVTPDKFSHVYLQAALTGGAGDGTGSDGETWVSLDPIMKDKPAGWEAPRSMVKLVKVYPENTTEDLNMTRSINGLGRTGMGYIADQRVVSHLSPDPTEEYVPGSDDGETNNGPGNYVVMDSMLDTDLPIEAISNNPPAFPMNAHYDRVPGPTLTQRRPRLYYENGDPAENWAYDKAQADQMNQQASVDAGNNPIQGLGGDYGIMGPAQLGALHGRKAGGAQPPVANPNVQALVQTPEGIDKMFARSAQVMNGKAGDRILYQGIQSLAERPPIRPANTVAGLGGVFGVQSRRAPMMGGLGALAGRSMSGPGIGDLCDLADDTANAVAPVSTTPMPVLPVSAPATSTIFGYPALGVIAAAGLAWYLLKKKKRA